MVEAAASSGAAQQAKDNDQRYKIQYMAINPSKEPQGQSSQMPSEMNESETAASDTRKTQPD